jgi:hypothetical protein
LDGQIDGVLQLISAAGLQKAEGWTLGVAVAARWIFNGTQELLQAEMDETSIIAELSDS